MRYIKVGNKRATICDCHYDVVAKYKWYLHKGYAATNISNKYYGMHKLVNDTKDGHETDHINNKPLDNRCTNLRDATTQENQMNRAKQSNNTSGYKGVYYDSRGYWRARIEFNNKKIHCGSSKDKDLAACYYDAAAIQLFGNFAYTNIL